MSSSAETEWVTVDLPEEPSLAAPPPSGGSRRGLGLLAAGVVAVLAVMLVWPQTDETPAADEPSPVAEGPLPEDARLLPWPGRGPWAGDEQFVDAAAAAWRAAARVDGSAPGAEVHALWAGPVGAVDVAVLQSVGDDGRTWVAQVTESRIPGSANPGALMLTSDEVVDAEPEFIALSYGGGLDLGGVLNEPGSALLQVLPAPGLLPDGAELQRQDGTRFETVALQDDGLSQPWVHTPLLAPAGPVLAAVRTEGARPGLLSTALIDPARLLPDPAPVRLVPAGWGRLRRDLPQDYVDGQRALEAVGRTSGRVSVLGSTPIEGGHASLVEVRPTGPGRPVVVTLGSRRSGEWLVSEPRPTTNPTEVKLGAVRSPAGDVLVVGVGPPEASLLVLGADSRAVARGARTTAVWLPRDAEVAEVAVQGYRDDETWVGRATLDVSDL